MACKMPPPVSLRNHSNRPDNRYSFSLKGLSLPLITGGKCMLIEDRGESTTKVLLPAMCGLGIGGTNSRVWNHEAFRLL